MKEKKIVRIGKLELGSGVPKICIPLCGKSEEVLLGEIERAKKYPADLLEWRIDFWEEENRLSYQNACSGFSILKTAEKIKKAAGELPVIFTFRSEKEGGNASLSNGEYETLNLKLAEYGLVDLVDVELFTYGGDFGKIKELVGKLHAAGRKVILSSHDFEKTPGKDCMEQRLLLMEQSGADIAKLAVMPQTEQDVLSLLAATRKVQENCGIPIVTMSMGKLGMVSRICGELTGSCMTFGTAGTDSAPGQLDAIKLKDILGLLHGVSK